MAEEAAAIDLSTIILEDDELQRAIDLSMLDRVGVVARPQRQQRPSSPHNTKETAIELIDSSSDDDDDDDDEGAKKPAAAAASASAPSFGLNFVPPLGRNAAGNIRNASAAASSSRSTSQSATAAASSASSAAPFGNATTAAKGGGDHVTTTTTTTTTATQEEEDLFAWFADPSSSSKLRNNNNSLGHGLSSSLATNNNTNDSASSNIANNNTAAAAANSSNAIANNAASSSSSFAFDSHSPYNFLEASKPHGCAHCPQRFWNEKQKKRHQKQCWKAKTATTTPAERKAERSSAAGKALQRKRKRERKERKEGNRWRFEALIKGETTAAAGGGEGQYHGMEEGLLVGGKEEGEEEDNVIAATNNEEAEEITYRSYRPAKLGYGRDHPDPVVENSTLSAVQPPDVTYNLAMPADIIARGKLSNLQLEAIVYGCQRHLMDLPAAAAVVVEKDDDNGGPDDELWWEEKKEEEDGLAAPEVPARAGFLLGDGAGMGKGRTLAGFVVENIARGRKKHVWISVSHDLYEDAKRDLRDLGLDDYADDNCYNLGKLPYGTLKQKEGVMFATYSTLIGKRKTGETRLDQLIEWCGGVDFDGLIMLDECHKAKTIELDGKGNPKTVGSGRNKQEASSQTATKVVLLHQALPRARVVYCSATSVSHPKNLGFMSRLGLWGPGTEHPSGFNQFLEGLKRLGTGAMELHAMHLKSTGALCARTLSYETCEFELVDGVSNPKIRSLYNRASEIWTDLHAQLADRCKKLNERDEMQRQIERLQGDMSDDEGGNLGDGMRYHLDLHRDSDSESDDGEDGAKLAEERMLRRIYRKRQSKILKSLFWSAHQRFFRSLCIASKVDKAIDMAKKALDDGHCCVIGLQSTGEARSRGAAKAAGYNADDGGSFDEFASAPNEDLKRIIMMMFPLPPKPRGVIAPEFLNPLKNKNDDDATSNGECNDPPGEDGRGKRSSSRGRNPQQKKRKLSGGRGSRRYQINWDEISLDLGIAPSVEKERMVNYRKAADTIKKYLDSVDELELPANPLDRLLNELGGPDKVAELTGRKHRQIRRYDKTTGGVVVSYEKRKGVGPFSSLNVEEKNNFQSGKKHIAILSEAASTGISLQADKRVGNQRRRVHITLELPWSADKAIQQLGRTHRANQSTGPMYKFLISDVGGEKRFAAAVAKRLALLGALTQGDRRATGQSSALGLGGFDMDTKFGQKALRTMLSSIWECSSSTLTDAPDSRIFEAVKLIDSHLETALEGDGEWRDNLTPFEDDSKSEQTFYTMMETLLLGHCLRLAQQRVEAIQGGRSVAKFCESLENGSETKEVIKPKIDKEVKAAKKAGLNFNVLCFIWLFDVGVTQTSDKSPMGVPKFLNRCLGMNLMRQKLMTEYFLKHLEKEISNAKRAGEYDVGIKSLSGNSLSVNKPRAFCFRGLEAKEEQVLLYKITVDRGMSSKAALELYNDTKAMEEEAGSTPNAIETDTGADGWFGGGQSPEIISGFYIDRRSNMFKEVPRMFLIISQGRTSGKCVVIRPNEGKKVYPNYWVKNKLINGTAQLRLCTDIDNAVSTWDREFNLADRPASESYQRYCYGRHDESFVFSGSIVPILNKILASANSNDGNDLFGSEDTALIMPSIVRVEPSAQQPTDNENESPGGEDTSNSSLEASCNDGNTVEAPAVGHKVAHRVLGRSVLRGIITEFNADDTDGADQSGTFVTRFTDGCNIEMDCDEANNAKELFESEVKKLVVQANVPRADARNIEIHTLADSTAKVTARRPILTQGEENNTEEYERLFEEESSGQVPKLLVGLEFPKRFLDWYSQSANGDIKLPFWQYVLRKLAEKLTEEGATSSRQLLNLEKAEQLQMGI